MSEAEEACASVIILRRGSGRGDVIFLTPKDYERHLGSLFAAEDPARGRIDLEKRVDTHCSEGVGYVFIGGEYVGRYALE